MKKIIVTVSEVGLVGRYLVITGYKNTETFSINPDEILPEIKLALNLEDLDHQKTIRYLLTNNRIPAKPSTWERVKLLVGRDITIYDNYIVTGEEELEEAREKRSKK